MPAHLPKGNKKMTQKEIRSALERSSLRGLVPPVFEIIGDEIEFQPYENFWQRWRVDRNFLETLGVRVYAIPRYRTPKPSEWRARVLVELLDELKNTCKRCSALIDERGNYCPPCWKDVS